MLTLITMSQGNPIALRRTLDSFKPYVSEVIFGDLLIFEEDRDLIKTYCDEYNMKMVSFPFNYIFHEGFAKTLNRLTDFATNKLCLYMNVSEVLDPNTPKSINVDLGWDAWYLTHATEVHKWYRMYDKSKMMWKGLIHEESHPIVGDKALYCTKPSFQFADTEKDMDNSFKAAVYNDIKELTYFSQYIRLVDDPSSIGVTHPGWVSYAKDGYGSLMERLLKKGKRYEAFKKGNLQMYLEEVNNTPDFEKERFESSDLINLQGVRKDVL